jgi:hypothetical protein
MGAEETWSNNCKIMAKHSATIIGRDEKMFSSLKRIMKKTFTRIWMGIKKGLPNVPMH